MKFERLQLRGLRCIGEASLDLADGFNVLVGANGAGKTSVLEAAFLLSHGRSFRSGSRDVLMQRGASGLSIFSTVRHADARVVRLGLGREGTRWEARVDGTDVLIGQLVRECAVVCFEPGSHALIAGSAEERRRFLDWGVFHVEQDFLSAWRRYQRALKQRNSLLRKESAVSEDLYGPWEQELARSGTQIDQWRRRYLDALLPYVREQASLFLGELGDVELRYRPGWPEGEDLAGTLAMQRARDQAKRHTTSGVHRADWSLSFAQAPQREHLSRGQEKLVALACLLAQARLDADHRGEWPIICLDDLASELDLAHQASVVESLLAAPAQVLITGTEMPKPLEQAPNRLFHVEQGRFTPLL
ncbi:DNA replication/repair protein RecF [Dyella flava]|uniref:DNA replication and repair protein RecF n=1 Tax=Dyella flava TaxID=1920170 RepID=A0ABS2JZ63_9GAMM|nr:DNA replication/repair protein RecF [Dyella flava]MBM7124292.1 DNA replication/repair protein RecF [Dyella flava]GLQ50429.1 DNA replication and repair protein RecF [Dyella flava]